MNTENGTKKYKSYFDERIICVLECSNCNCLFGAVGADGNPQFWCKKGYEVQPKELLPCETGD